MKYCSLSLYVSLQQYQNGSLIQRRAEPRYNANCAQADPDSAARVNCCILSGKAWQPFGALQRHYFQNLLPDGCRALVMAVQPYSEERRRQDE